MQNHAPQLRPLKSKRLLDQLRERIRYDHYSVRTEQAYVFWVRRFIRFHGLRHPQELGGAEVERFLTHLVTAQGIAASTHRQALAALLYLYRHVIGVELPWMTRIGRPRAQLRVPMVLSREEVARLLSAVDLAHRLMASILYGTGLRLRECLTLRVKDVDFDRNILIVRCGKGGKDRLVMLPRPIRESLRAQLRCARSLWAEDRARNLAGVEVPQALARKYPRTGESWGWYWVFPADRIAMDPRSGIHRRHYQYAQTVSRALARASAKAAIPKHVTARAQLVRRGHPKPVGVAARSGSVLQSGTYAVRMLR